jgi:AraC-like DNA-binding protein
MKPIVHLDHIAEINRFLQVPTRHPLVAVVDFSQMDDAIEEGTRISSSFYTVMFKNYCKNLMKYGRLTYDFQEGNLICIAPNQVLTMDTEITDRTDKLGWGLFFHPDLLRGSALANRMDEYSFFSYDVAEALHLSEMEKDTLKDCVNKIEIELNNNIDMHSQTLIVSNIELLLNYCSRYYSRQFITRKVAHSATVAEVERFLRDYFKPGSARDRTLPTVKLLAEKVHLSPSYLSDLLKRETGMSAQDQIHYHLIEAAKTILVDSDQSVSEIAYALGFEYPQYFSKLFKLKTGFTPGAFRQLN